MNEYGQGMTEYDENMRVGGQSIPEGGNDTRRVFLLDTIGELPAAYLLADAVFVGRSLVPMGGSNPLEPAALGRPP